MTSWIAALSLSLAAAGPSAELGGEAPLFSRAEPSLVAGAAALQDGDVDAALERFRKARADTPNQRAIVEYDVGQAMVARALASAAATPPDPNAPDGHAAAPTLDKTMVDDAQAAFTRARGLALDPRLKAEAALAGGNLAAFAGDADQAIAQYRQALRDDPTNERARKNLRRALEAKKQQPPPQDQGGQDDKKDDKKDENKDENKDDKKDPKDGDQQGDQKQDQDDPKGDDQREPPAGPKPGEGDKDGDKKEAPPPTAAEGKKDPKKEAARRLLDALRARERPLTPLEMRGAKPVRPKEGKDW